MNISIERAAKLMNVSPQFLRICLQRGVFDFGKAIKQNQNGNRYTYYINAKQFAEYIGKPIDEVIEERT